MNIQTRIRSWVVVLWAMVLKLLGFSEATTFKEFIKTLVIAVAIAVGVRTVFVEPFKIPSGSMHPTLIEGDFLLVNKWSYGYSRYSFPFNLKLFEGRIGFSQPLRGDVAVFKPPHRVEEWWIKRIVGLPGDRVVMKQGVLHINDQPVRIKKTEDYGLDMWNDRQGYHAVDQFIETLPEGHEHNIIHDGPLGEHWLDNTDVFVVPAGHYFVMGDNRCHSADSRVLGGVGCIPEDYLVGKASLVFFSTDARLWEIWRWPFAIRYKRLLRWIH